VGIVGGTGALQSITIARPSGRSPPWLAYSFREFLIAVLPPMAAKDAHSAAHGGLRDVGDLHLCGRGIFAPAIAPFGEAEVIGRPYPGRRQLGRDMFSRSSTARGTRSASRSPPRRWPSSSAPSSGFWRRSSAAGSTSFWAARRRADGDPALIFALLLLTIVGTSIINMILVIALIDAPRVFRLARAVAMNIVVMDYVEAAKLRGEGLWRLITREILPNALAPLVAEFGLRFCFVFLPSPRSASSASASSRPPPTGARWCATTPR
jgi:peptide/nickel transport system permease protein